MAIDTLGENLSFGGGSSGSAESSSAAPKGGSAGGGAMVSAGIISGLADIAVGFINAGRIKQTAKFNIGMADIEARMAQTKADFTARINRVSAKYAIAQIRKQSDSLYSTQRALYAKSGVTLDGSPAEVMMASLREAELDVFATDLNADLASWSGQFMATQIASEKKAEAGLYAMGAKTAYANAGAGASKTILNMMSSYAMKG